MEKDLRRFQDMYFNEIKEGVRWHVGEKIHGANTSFLLLPNDNPRYFSRKNDITNDMFYGAGEIYESTRERLKWAQEYADNYNKTVRIYGELFGAGIQKGVDYGHDKRILFYDAVINDVTLTLLSFDMFMKEMDVADLRAPTFGIFDTFEEAFNFDIERVTALHDNGDPDNWIEGIVIKPYDKVLEDENGSLFYIKKKNEKFKEKQSVKKAKTVTNYTEEVNKWHETFLGYIHEERLESVFSKEGRFEDIKEMGKYMKAVYEDTIETFYAEEDFPENNFTKAEKKYILNGNTVISTLLKQELMKA